MPRCAGPSRAEHPDRRADLEHAIAYNRAPGGPRPSLWPFTIPEKTTVPAAASADAEAVAARYNHFVLRTIVTFEEEPVSPGEIARRMDDVREAPCRGWLRNGGNGCGLCLRHGMASAPRLPLLMLTKVTVYVAPGAGGLGIGSLLYAELIPALEDRGIQAAMGGLRSPTTPASRCMKVRVQEGRALRAGGRQVRPLDRRRLLAAHL